jgi:hypothetical protein
MIALAVTYRSEDALVAMNALTAPFKKEAYESIGLLLISRAKDNIATRTGPSGPWPSGPWTELYAGPRIWRDISRSLVVEATSKGVAVGATHIAAGVRQLGTIGAGGTEPDIVPVKKKALTIPLNDAASRASYQGFPAREAFPDAFLLTKDGRHGASPLSLGVIARKKENQTLELLYLLTARSSIRPHPFLPINKDGALAPASLETEIDELIIDNFMQRAG